MPRTKRQKPLYQRGPYALQARTDRENLEIIWYDAERRRERSTSAGTGDLWTAKLALDRLYLQSQGQQCCPTCGRLFDGETAPLLTSAIRDYLILGEDKAGFKATRGRLAHVVEFVAETDPNITVPQADQRFVDRFRNWLAERPVVSPTGAKQRPRSLGHIEGCVRQLAAAINATRGQTAQFRAEQPRDVSRSPSYRADVPTIAAMFRFCIDPPPPEGRDWSDKERAMVVATRVELLRFLRAAVATWARPDAIFDIKPNQWFPSARVLDLNPVGRRQTRKHRPKIPVARQFMPWLDEIVPSKVNPGRTTYLANATVRHGWDTMRAYLGLPEEGEAGQKLIRRSMATIVRKRIGEANWAQGKMMLGHVKFDVSDIYAIPDPANLGLALAATESVIDEIEKLCPGAFYRENTASDAAESPSNGGLSV